MNPNSLSPEALDALADKAELELARRDLGTFGEFVFNLKCLPHIRQWCNILMDDSVSQVLLIAPPGHGKSSWVNTIFPSWWIGHHPDHHVISLSHAHDHAEKFSTAVRNAIQNSPEYHRVFPHIEPNISQGWSQSKWYIKRPNKGDPHPTMLASGWDGPIHGSRANLMILDDVLDEDMAASAEQREKLKERLRNTAFPRRLHGCKTVCILTRWNEDDLGSMFLNDPSWVTLHMPAIGFWGKDKPLAPEIMPLEALLEIKNNPQNGSLRFENIYQGNPSNPTGNILNRSWWKRIPLQDLPRREDCRMLVQVWDTANKKKAENAFSVCLTMGRTESGDIIIYNMFRKKMEFPELLKKTRELYKIEKPRLVLIEDKSSGTSIIQAIKAGTGAADDDTEAKTLPVLEMPANNDPIAYVSSFAGYVEAGRCILPNEGFWVQDFLDENASFPRSTFRDIPMTWAHGMAYLTAGSRFAPLKDGTLILPEHITGEPELGSWSDLPGAETMTDFLKEFQDNI